MTLGLVNATNARDLGGLLTADGRRVRSGLLFRSNALNRLTDADLDVVAKLGLSYVVDLRSDREVVMVGPDRLPEPAPRLLALPLSDPDNQLFAGVTAVVKGDVAYAEVEARLEAGVLTGEMLRAYRWLATSGPAREAYATVLRLIADSRSLPLLFHCSAGKDRTGWLGAVVLTVLGVDQDTIAVDYLRSTELSRPTIEHILSRLDGRVPDPSAVLPMLEARPEYLAEAMRTVAAEYGDMATYLHDGLGLDEAVLAAVRANLLE